MARDRVAEYVTALAMQAATSARVADEVRTLARPEFGELEETWEYGKIGSSTMPHKRNALPEACEQIVVLARLARSNTDLGLEGMIAEHERDSRVLRLEWVAVPDVSHYTLAALAILDRVLRGFVVLHDRMRQHAYQGADAICPEALMPALGRHIGKQSAHSPVYEVSQQAQQEGRSLRDILSVRPEVGHPLSTGQLERILDPARYLGAAGPMVDETLHRAELWSSEEPPVGSIGFPATGPAAAQSVACGR